MTVIEMNGIVHAIKMWPEYFEAMMDGRKTFDVRVDDRGYAVGDMIKYQEWQPDPAGIVEGAYTGRAETAVVTYVYSHGPVDLPGRVVVLGLSVGGVEL